METQTAPHDTTKKVAPQSDTEQIQRVLDEVSRAAGALEIDAVMTQFADDIVTFDCPPPLASAGRHAIRERWAKNIGDVFVAPITYRYEDVHITARDDLAVARSFMRFVGITKGGKEMKAMVRCTHVLEKRGGRWLIVHDHQSVPIDGDGNAVMGLEK